MEPIIISGSVVAVYIADKVLDNIIQEGILKRFWNYLFPDPTYRDRLIELSKETIKAFELKFPVDPGANKYPFFQSKTISDYLCEFILFGEKKISNHSHLINEFKKNPKIKIPTQNELIYFFEYFIDKVNQDTKLKNLFLNENFKEEIFNISKSLQHLYEIALEIKDDTSQIKHSISEILAIVSNKTNDPIIILNEQYQKQIDGLEELREKDNPFQALELLNDFIKKNWETAENKVKYKVLINIGICHLEINKEKEASMKFIEALQYNDNDEKAFSFAALGYAILEEFENAEKLINEALAKNQLNVNAHLALIALESKQGKNSEDVISKIPEDILSSPEIAHSIGIIYRDKRDFEKSISYFRIALKNSKDSRNAEYKASLAATILESIQRPLTKLFSQINEIESKLINEAIVLLNQAWDDVKDKEIRKVKLNWLTNRSLAYRFIGSHDQALSDIKEAYNNSKNDLYILRNLFILYYEKEMFDEAEEIINKLISLYPSAEFEHYLSIIYFKKNRIEECILLIQKILSISNLDYKIRDQSNSLLISCYLTTNQIEETKKLTDELIKNNPKSFKSYLNALRLYSVIDNKEKILEVFSKVKENIIYKESEDTDIFYFSEFLLENSEYDEAVIVLESIYNPSIFNEISQRLIHAYFHSGDKKKALELCQYHKTNSPSNDFLVNTEAIIYESIGDLPKAISIYDDYLKSKTEDNFIRIRLATIYHRLEDLDNLKEVILKIKDPHVLPFELGYRVALYYSFIGEFEKSLSLSYEIRRNNYNLGKSHLKYIGLNTQSRGDRASLLKTDTVKADTLVTLENDNKSIVKYIIEERKDPKNEFNEISINDPFAKMLIGKQVGDIIEIKKGYNFIQTFKIVGIASKHIHAFQDSINLLKNRFTNIKDFLVFNIPEGGNPKDELEKIFDRFSDQETAIKQLDEFYIQGQIPIGTYASIRKMNPIHIWSYLTNKEELGISPISKFNNEDTIFSELIAGKDIILDIIPLISLAQIKSLDILKTLPNKIIISQSTFEIISNLMNELKESLRLGITTVFKKDGELYRDDLSKEQLPYFIQNYEELIKWCSTHLQIMPCLPALKVNSKLKESYDKLLTANTTDSILLAQENNSIFITDEWNLQDVVKSKYNVNSTSLIILLKYLKNNQLISQEDFEENIVKLISLNYKGLPISASIIWKCADKDNFKPLTSFTRGIQSLSYKISTEDSSINVSVDFFYQLYSDNNLILNREKLTLPILSILINNRSNKAIYYKLKNRIEIKFRLLQLQKDELLNIIDTFFSI